MLQVGNPNLTYFHLSCVCDGETEAQKADMNCPRTTSRMIPLTPALVFFTHPPYSKFPTFVKELGFKLGRQIVSMRADGNVSFISVKGK